MSEERESVKVLLEAAELQRRKSKDYQNPNSTVQQADYYPNGVRTIDDIIHAKKLRARSLLESGETPKFESLEDTYLDMINYCSFAIAYLRGKVPGQDPSRDAFNRPKPVTATAWTPSDLGDALKYHYKDGVILKQPTDWAKDWPLPSTFTHESLTGSVSSKFDPLTIIHNGPVVTPEVWTAAVQATFEDHGKRDTFIPVDPEGK